MLKNERAQKRGRREAKKQEKTLRIEAAARASFADAGYEATTTRAIAEQAEIAVGTLFTYFPNKRALLFHIVRGDLERAVDDAFAHLPAVPPADPVDALLSIFAAIYRVYEADERMAKAFVKEALFAADVSSDRVGTELAAWTFSFIARLGKVVEEWRSDGIVGSHVDSPTAGFQAFSHYYFALVSWLGSSAVTPEVRDSLLRASLRQLMRGLGPNPGDEP